MSDSEAHADNRGSFEDRTDAWERETMFIVEATDFEKLTLWREHGGEEGRWEQMGVGRTYDYGNIAGRTLRVTFFWDRIDGCMVGFYSFTSSTSDRLKLEEWLQMRFGDRKWDNGHRWAQTNAMNFHHCLDAIRERS